MLGPPRPSPVQTIPGGRPPGLPRGWHQGCQGGEKDARGQTASPGIRQQHQTRIRHGTFLGMGKGLLHDPGTVSSSRWFVAVYRIEFEHGSDEKARAGTGGDPRRQQLFRPGGEGAEPHPPPAAPRTPAPGPGGRPWHSLHQRGCSSLRRVSRGQWSRGSSWRSPSRVRA